MDRDGEHIASMWSFLFWATFKKILSKVIRQSPRVIRSGVTSHYRRRALAYKARLLVTSHGWLQPSLSLTMFTIITALALCARLIYAQTITSAPASTAVSAINIPTSAASPTVPLSNIIPSQFPLPPVQAWCPSQIFCAGALRVWFRVSIWFMFMFSSS